jgi:hypothetical protein
MTARDQPGDGNGMTRDDDNGMKTPPGTGEAGAGRVTTCDETGNINLLMSPHP